MKSNGRNSVSVWLAIFALSTGWVHALDNEINPNGDLLVPCYNRPIGSGYDLEYDDYVEERGQHQSQHPNAIPMEDLAADLKKFKTYLTGLPFPIMGGATKLFFDNMRLSTNYLRSQVQKAKEDEWLETPMGKVLTLFVPDKKDGKVQGHCPNQVNNEISQNLDGAERRGTGAKTGGFLMGFLVPVSDVMASSIRL